MKNKTYTIEDLHIYAKEKDAECLSTKYINTLHAYKWKCLKCGHIWESTWASVLYAKAWCNRCASIKRRKYTIEDLQKYAEEHGGKLISTKFTLANKHYKFECKEGHQWLSTWVNLFINKRWCNKCKVNKHPIKTEYFNPSIKSSLKACKSVSCQPTRQLWLKLFMEDKITYKRVDYKSIYDGIVKIELLMHKKRIFTSTKIILGVVLYLKSVFTQKKIAKLLNTTDVSLRNLIKAVKLKKERINAYNDIQKINPISESAEPITVKSKMDVIFNQLKMTEYRAKDIKPKIGQAKFKLWETKIEEYILELLEKHGKLRIREIYAQLPNINKHAINSRLKLLRVHKYVLAEGNHHGLFFYINENMI